MNSNQLATSQTANDVTIVNRVDNNDLVERVNHLTWQLLDELISEEEMAQLNRDLESSSEARQAYLDAMQMHCDLQRFFDNK